MILSPGVGARLMSLPALIAVVVIPSHVMSSYFVFGLVLIVGGVTIFLRGDWQKARGFDKSILFGPLFYAAPLAAFGIEHFTLTKDIASMVPTWIPWHLFWAYFVGACFVAAGFSLATRIQARLTASLLALTFFFFVVLMDAPAWARHPGNRIFLVLMLRELSFSGGALALAASLAHDWRGRSTRILTTIARYSVAIPVFVYSFEQFMHSHNVPAVPLERVTPLYIFVGPSIWTYIAALAYAVGGTLLLLGKKTRAAATWVGMTVLLVELVVYVPIAIVDRASIEGFNYLGDTLMFGGAVLLLAGAMPCEASRPHRFEHGSPPAREAVGLPVGTQT